jgi:germination protein M
MVAAAALGELLGGQPLFPGTHRPFPAGAGLRGVSIKAGTATVDLSGSALPGGTAGRWRLQALVHTLAQFPTVRRVKVERDGRAVAGPLTRDPGLPLVPIALAHPAPGLQVKGDRLVVKGEASVFEGTVGLRLRDDQGKVMAQSYATAAQGAPGRGPFSGALSFTPPATSRAWTLDAFEVSPEDGEITYAVTVPVWVGR